MIALIILAAVLLILLAVLFLPLDVCIKFLNDFYVKIKFAGVKVFEIEPKSKEKKSAPADTVSDQKAENEAVRESKQIFSFLKEKYGFMGAVKSVLSFVVDALSHIKRLLKHTKIKRVEFNLTVAGSDAAQTAIEYGVACTAVYPVMAFLNSCAEINFKNINVKSDFNSKGAEFNFSAVVRLRIFFCVLAAFKIYKEYKQFLLKENYNERK